MMDNQTVDIATMNAAGGKDLNRRTMLQAGGVAGLASALGASGLKAAQGTPEAAANANVEIVQRYYEVYAEGDLEALREFLAEDIVWRIPGHGPLAGEKRGVDEVLAFFAQLAKGGFRAETIVLAAGGEWVIDLHRGWSTEGEGQVDITWALAFRIVDGRITETMNFAFDQYAADTYWWANYPLKPIPDRLANP